MTDQTSRGDRYALSALRKRRVILAAEVIQLQSQIRARKDSLAHVDATSKLLDPEYDAGTVHPRRIPQRIRLFRQGELGRLILGALRDGDDGLSTGEIVKARGHGASARAAMEQRVRANLAYLLRRGRVAKCGNGKGVKRGLT